MPNLEPQRHRFIESFRSFLGTPKLIVQQFAEHCGLTEQALTNALYNSDHGRGMAKAKAQRIAQVLQL